MADQELPKGMPLFYVNLENSPSPSTSSAEADRVLLPIEPLDTDFGIENSDANIIFSTASGKPEIKAASLPKLVEYLTHEEYTHPLFARQFLLSFQSFTDAESLMRMLYDRFTWEPKTNSEHYIAQQQKLVQFRVFNVLRLWVLNHYPEVFHCNDDLLAMLSWFLEHMRSCGMEKYASSLANEVERKKKDPFGTIFAMSGAANRLKPIAPKKIRSVIDIDPEELARQFCLIEHELFKQIRTPELLGLNWSKRREYAPNVMRLINWSNRTVKWVSTVVVTEPSVKKRVRVVQLLIDAADMLKRMNNFNAVIEIVSGLNSSSCFRLRKTWTAIGKSHETRFQELCLMTASEGNFKHYRDLLSAVAPPLVPYIGRYLTDLTFIEDGNPDKIGELINFEKRRHVSKVIEDVLSFQGEGYPFFKVKIIDDFLKTSAVCSERELYEHSLAREKKVGTGETEVLPEDEKVHLEEDFGELEFIANYPFVADDTSRNIVIEGDMLEGATFVKLVEKATLPPANSLANASTSDVTTAILCNYSRFTTGLELVRLLRARFFMPRPQHCTPELLAHFEKIRCIPIRMRTVAFVNRWVNKHPQDLRTQPHVATALVSFLQEAGCEEAARGQTSSLIDAIEKLLVESEPSTVAHPPSSIHPKSAAKTDEASASAEASSSVIAINDFLLLPTREITRHLHSLCLSHYCNLGPQDFFQTSERLKILLAITEEIRLLFLSELCRPKTSPFESVQVFLHVLCVLEDSLACENLLVVPAIVAALEQCMSTYKVIYGWLHPSLAKAVNSALELYSPSSTSAVLTEWSTEMGIPPLGGLLLNLQFLMAESPDYLAPDIINFRKSSSLANLFSTSLFISTRPSPPAPSCEVIAYLTRIKVLTESEALALLPDIVLPTEKPFHPLIASEDDIKQEPARGSPTPQGEEEVISILEPKKTPLQRNDTQILRKFTLHTSLKKESSKKEKREREDRNKKHADKEKEKEKDHDQESKITAAPAETLVTLEQLQERLTQLENQNKRLTDQNKLLIDQHRILESLVKTMATKLLVQVRPLEPEPSNVADA